MRYILKTSLFCLCACGVLSGQASYDVTFEKKTGYNGWSANWGTVYSCKNSIVTLAIVPKLGGRVMQYDLGTHRSLYIHDSSVTPESGNDVVGGFRVLPSPQSDFNWPSPPNLDFNPYTCTERVNNADSAVIYLESQVENSTDSKYEKHKGLQFKRLITMYKASTRVKVEMTMLNKGTQSMKHGIWDITQTVCPSASCWVYFKRSTPSIMGDTGYVHYSSAPGGASQWNPNAAEGNIMGVEYLQETGKIGADCKAGWICFNDRTNGYAYVKTFTYQEGKEYPDEGASVQVYTYSMYNVFEVEVLGPLVTLAAGDSTKLVENWYAARSLGPVLAVNSAGLITNKLKATQPLPADSMNVTGTFGVFYPGKVKSQFCNAAGAVVATADSVAVVPTDSLRVNKKFAVPAGATSLRLAAFGAGGNPVGTLDSVAVPNPVSAREPKASPNRQGNISIMTGKNRAVNIIVPYDGTFTTDIFTVDGKLATSFCGKAPYRHSIDMSTAAAAVFLVRVKGAGITENRVVYTQQGE